MCGNVSAVDVCSLILSASYADVMLPTAAYLAKHAPRSLAPLACSPDDSLLHVVDTMMNNKVRAARRRGKARATHARAQMPREQDKQADRQTGSEIKGGGESFCVFQSFVAWVPIVHLPWFAAQVHRLWLVDDAHVPVGVFTLWDLMELLRLHCTHPHALASATGSPAPALTPAAPGPGAATAPGSSAPSAATGVSPEARALLQMQKAAEERRERERLEKLRAEEERVRAGAYQHLVATAAKLEGVIVADVRVHSSSS